MTAGLDDLYTTAVTVDLQAIVNNYHLVCETVGPQTEVAAVVKADAYGHGMIPVAEALWRAGCRTYCVVSLAEAAALKQTSCGMDHILKLTPSLPHEYEEVQRLGIEQVVTSVEDRQGWEEWLNKDGKTLRIHLKADCGMGRLGYTREEFLKETVHLAESKCFQVVGVMCHLPASEEDPASVRKGSVEDIAHTSEEIGLFSQLAGAAVKMFKSDLKRHIANSGGALFHPEGRFNMTRAGLALYGSDPRGEDPLALGLQPAMSFRTHLVQVRDFAPGKTIGYGRTFRTGCTMRVGVIPVGYADGLFRQMAALGYVLVRGQRCKILGRISMDLISIDLSGIDGVRMGERVTLLGEDHGGRITAEEMARWAGTISYEVFTNIGHLRAVHIHGGIQALP